MRRYEWLAFRMGKGMPHKRAAGIVPNGSCMISCGLFQRKMSA